MPMDPIGYFSRQQKRNFYPETSNMVLKGQQKEKVTRNRIRKRVTARDTGV